MTKFKNDKIKYFAIVLCVFIAIAAMTFPTGVMLCSGGHTVQFFGVNRAAFHNYTAYSFAMGQAQRFEPWIESPNSDTHTEIKLSALNRLINYEHSADALFSLVKQAMDKHGILCKMNFYLRI